MAESPLNLLPVLAPSSWPQIVPSADCLRCDTCCRFPDPDSPLRPYFTENEIDRAVTTGLDARHFPSRRGSQISLVPAGEGYHCPAFEPATSRCRIYEDRPLDCRLYPLALLWNERHDEVMLGWDAKCPFMREQIPAAIKEHADRVTALLARPEMVETMVRHPRLIGAFQDDVVRLWPLPGLAHAIERRWGAEPMHRLTMQDLPRFRAALAASALSQPRSPAAYSAAYHYMCNALLAYWWTEIDDAFYLFAEAPDGWFMPLPPLTGGSLQAALDRGFGIMRRLNGNNSPVSRIENLSADTAAKAASLGYRLVPKEGDYLYRAEELADLSGGRFKSQRGLCHRIERLPNVTVAPYEAKDREACRRLFEQWRRQKERETPDSYGRWLLADAASSHEVVWSHAAALGLGGTVVRIDGTIRAYTFGYWLTDKTWCVLLEIADRAVSGLAQYLFRESARRARAGGAEFLNTMDDAGLPGLRLSKRMYHPMMTIGNFILSEDRG